MKLPITIIVFYTIATFSYAGGIEVGYKGDEPCESYDFFHEMDKIPKFDSTKHFVAAKYCLIERDRLSLYEQVIPLVIRIQKKCQSHSIDGIIYLEPFRIFLGSLSGGWHFCTAYSIHPHIKKECKEDINEFYNIYKYIKDFYVDYCSREADNVSYLLDKKYLHIKWELEILCDDEKIPIPVLENYYIYVSGICDEEQLKKIEEDKKNE